MSKKPIQRQYILLALFLMGGLVLWFNLAYLQLFDDSLKQKAKAATIDKQVLYPSRGLIYDRNQNLLVFNEPLYDIKLIKNKMSPDMDTSLFCELLGITKSDFENALDVDWSSSLYSKSVPYTFLKRVPAETYNRFAEQLYQFPGFIPVLKNTRGYKTDVAAHILGYLSEVNQKTIDQSNGKYARGDNIGMSGIEKSHEDDLKGTKGLKYVLKDKWGRNVGSFQEGELDTSAQSGLDLVLSLDVELQKYGEMLMKGRRGSIVALDPKTGEVLSMVSAPDFKPSALAVTRNRGKYYNELLNDTLKPFFNRAISAKYPPGSIFKPVMALIGLENGIIQAEERFRCQGAYYYKTVSWGCHAGAGIHDVSSAIQHSCNSYFYDLYKRSVETYGWENPELGLDKLNNYLNQFGLGKKLGIDLPYETTGLVPGSTFYDNLYSFQQAEWRSTYIISNGIGQGEVQLTTLQMANLAAILANRGYFYTPHIVKGYKNSLQQIPKVYRTKNSVDIQKKHFEPVIKGMEYAVKYGTAGLAQVPGIEVCGKTGTSENSQGKDHSVFFAFAPKDDPKIAVAVYIENAGWGGAFAAPIASLMIEKYIRGEIAPHRKYLENRMNMNYEPLNP